MKKVFALILALSLVLTLAACASPAPSASTPAASTGGSQSTTASAGKQAVKVAVMCPLSGESARFGEIYRASITAAMKAIEEDGYLKDYTLEFEYIDDKGSTDGAPMAATYALDQYGCNVAIGHMLTTMILADGQYFEDAKTPLLGIVSGPASVSQGWEYLSIETGTDLQQAQALIDYLVGELKYEKISLININTEGGMTAAKEIERYLDEKYSLKLATQDQLTNDDTDFTAQVLNMKNAGTDCVIFWGLSQANGQLCNTQVKQLYKPDIFFAGGTNLAQAQMLDTWNEEDIVGVVYPVGYIPTDDADVQRFIKNFKEADVQKQDPADVPARVYDAVYHIATALNDMGQVDVSAEDFNTQLNSALRKAKFQGVQGMFDFSAFDNGVGLGQMNVGRWGEGYSQSKVFPKA